MSLRNGNNGVQRPPNPGKSLDLAELLSDEAMDVGDMAANVAQSATRKGGLAAVKACSALADLGQLLCDLLQEIDA